MMTIMNRILFGVVLMLFITPFAHALKVVVKIQSLPEPVQVYQKTIQSGELTQVALDRCKYMISDSGIFTFFWEPGDPIDSTTWIIFGVSTDATYDPSYFPVTPIQSMVTVQYTTQPAPKVPCPGGYVYFTIENKK